MPLNTQLQDVNRIMDPGVKHFPTDMSGFNIAYQYAANRRKEKDEQDQAYSFMSRALESPEPLDAPYGPKDAQGNTLHAKKTVPEMLAEFSQLPVDKMEEKIATMAPMAMTSAGGRIVSVFSQIADKKRLIENQSAAKLLQGEYNRRVATALAKFGGNPQDPASISKALKNQSYFEILDLAKGQMKDPSAPLPPDAIDDSGMINMQAVHQWIGTLPPSERIQSAENIAQMRNDLESQRRQVQDDLASQRISNETARLQLQQISMGLREVDQKIKAAGLGFEVQGGPAIPTTPGGATLKPVERPATTGTVGKLQQESINADNALRSLNEASKAITENPSAIGVRGVIGSAVEKAKGQLAPGESMATPITESRQKASLAFSSVAKSLRVDSGNMSRYELNKLEQAGDVLDWTEAPQTALRKIQNLQAVVLAKKLRDLKVLNAKPENSLLRQIPSSEIAGLVQSGLLSQEDAIRWHQLGQ